MLASAKDEEIRQTRYRLQGLICSGCAAKIEKEVKKLPGVIETELNLATSSITIKENNRETIPWLEILQEIVDRIEPGIVVRKIDKTLIEDSKLETASAKETSGSGRFWLGVALFLLAILLYEIPYINRQITDLPQYLEWVIFGSSYLLLGGPVLMAAFRNIKKGQVFDENFLMTVATLGAFAIREFSEGVAVMFFYMIGDMFQKRAVDHSRRSIKEMMDIRPDYANLQQGDNILRIDPREVKPGDTIIIKPGERIPLDGEVLEGTAMIDSSALTGEAIPQKVEAGDEILSGMINKDGLLKVKVTKEYNQSTVARILELVENATGKKAPTEKFITRFARYYTPVVVFIALAIAVLPPLILADAGFSDWLYRALIFLVISCPCALVISIPLGFFGGIGKASRQGILVKGGNYLETLNYVSQIVFDKTGTLTRGKFTVTSVVAANGYNPGEVLAKAAAVERNSTHPIALSIVEAYKKSKSDLQTGELEDFQEIGGQGIKAIIDGQEILVGNQKLMKEMGVDCPPVSEEGTIVFLAVAGEYAGYIVINDELKVDAVTAVKGLKESGIRELTMLTGDREAVSQRIAEKLGLTNYYAGLLPDQKVKIMEKLMHNRGKKGKVLFVGDGINDAPVLARADIGVAMGGLGSDAAIEAADIVLMTDEPSKLLAAIQIARKTRIIIWQNIILALGVKGIVMMMGAFGAATMWEAVFADVGVALLAVLNSIRIIWSGDFQINQKGGYFCEG